MARNPVGSTLDLAVIRRVYKTHVECDWMGRTGEKSFTCPMPHPYAGNGGGYLAGIEKGTVVLVASGTSERKFIVAFVPLRRHFFSPEGVENSDINITPIPELDEGQLRMKSSFSGSYVDISPSGNVSIDGGAGNFGADFEISTLSKSTFFRTDNQYSFTESGRKISGIIKRDKSKTETSGGARTFDFLTSETYDKNLTEIGRSPTEDVSFVTSNISKTSVRNPPLVENRNVVYEYANGYNVRNLSFEINAMGIVKDPNINSNIKSPVGTRDRRRTDVLNLNMYNFNHLIEKVEGTLVDIYGNILDINRNIIDIPDSKLLKLGKTNNNDVQEDVKKIYAHMRRSIKYHFEINSRKDINGDEPGRTKESIRQREHSRWSIDIDGEGLTKINIPASSDYGNIPVLGRYLTSINTEKDKRDDPTYRDPDGRDIRLHCFGVGGPEIADSKYKPVAISGGVTAGTAYHDMLDVASALFAAGKWNEPGITAKSTIKNQIGARNNNAGGRSLHANLDGSAEVSIGADNIDKKSLVLDLEGGVISHYGVDDRGRSIVHQSDGTVLIQIGGQNAPGRLEIHLVNGSTSQSKIIVDEAGFTLDTQGNMVFNTTGLIGLNGSAGVMLNGALISMYGSVDASPQGARTVGIGSVVITPSGLPHIGFLG